MRCDSLVDAVIECSSGGHEFKSRRDESTFQAQVDINRVVNGVEILDAFSPERLV